MNNSPMQPVRFFIDEITVRTNHNYTPKPGIANVPQITVSDSFEHGEDPQGNPVFRHCLKVVTTPINPEQSLPYTVEASVIGFFTRIMGAKIEGDVLQRLAAFNGLAMLYGFARDVVVQTTANAEHGPFMLPAVDLTDLAAKLLEPPEAAVESDAPTESGARRARSPRPRKSASPKRS